MPTHHTQSRGSHQTSKYNKNYSGSAESEEIALLKNKYSSELPTLRELFPTWSEEDILFTLQENQGDLMLTIDRISEGFATQWDEVKTAKPKKEAPFTTQNTRNQQQSVQDKTKHKAPASARGPKNGPGSSGKKFSNQDAASIERNFQELRLNSETTAWDEQPTNDTWDNANNQDSWGKSKSHHSKSGHQTSKGKGQGNKNKTEVKEEPPKPAVKSWASIVKPKAAEPAKPKAPTQPPKPEPIENKQEQEPKVPEVPSEDKKEEILPVEQAAEPELDSEVAQPEQVEATIPDQIMEFPSAEVVPEIPQIPQIPEQQIPAPVPSSIPVPASVPVSQNASGVKFGNFQSNTNFTSGNAPSFGSLNFSQAPRANLPPGLSLPNQVPPSRPSQPASVPYSRPAQQAQEQADASASPNTRQSVPQAQQATSQAPLSRGPAPGNLNNAYSNANASQFADNKSPFPNYYHPSKFNPHQRPNVGVPPAYSQQYGHPQQTSYQQHSNVPYPTAQFEYHQQNDAALLSNPAKKESPAVESNNLNSASSATAQPPSASSANSSTQQHSYHPQSNETLSHSHPQQQQQQQQQQQFQHHQPHFNHNIYQQHSQYYHDSYMHTQPYNPYTYDPYNQHYSQPHYQPQQYQSGYTHPSAGNYAHPSSRSNKPFWTTKH